MAFVKIYKQDKSLVIPKGAYLKQYAPAGWELSNDFPVQKTKKENKKEESVNSEEKSENEPENEPEMAVEENLELEELEEKPLSELSIPELRTLAELKGIDTTGLTSAKRLRDAIKHAE